MSHPIRSRLPAFAVALTLASLGAACSSSNATSDTTAASASSPTTEAVATVPTPTSTTSVPATNSTTVEDAIRAAHTRFITELMRWKGTPEDDRERLALAEQWTTGAQLQRMKEAVAGRVSSGEYIVGGYESSIVSVDVEGPASARVVDCSKDLGVLYSKDGRVVIPADDFYKFRETRLELVDGAWLVNDFITGGDAKCDPA